MKPVEHGSTLQTPFPIASTSSTHGVDGSTKVDTYRQAREPVEGGVGPVEGA